MTSTEDNSFHSNVCFPLSYGVFHTSPSKFNNYKVQENGCDSICYRVNWFQKVNEEDKWGGSLKMKSTQTNYTNLIKLNSTYNH